MHTDFYESDTDDSIVAALRVAPENICVPSFFIGDSAAKTTNFTNDTKCPTEKIRAICEIRGSCSELIGVYLW
jgi:hypothetical protein